jgi:hypothetical protein
VIPVLNQAVDILQKAVEGVQGLSNTPAQANLINVATGAVADVTYIVGLVAPVVKVCTFSSSPVGSC